MLKITNAIIVVTDEVVNFCPELGVYVTSRVPHDWEDPSIAEICGWWNKRKRSYSKCVTPEYYSNGGRKCFPRADYVSGMCRKAETTVAINIQDPPPEEIIKLTADRAKRFAIEWSNSYPFRDSDLQIIDVRYVI